jgi:oxygen-dependent protoporphyrinogen oxidase
MRPVAILGAGIAGLAAAYELHQRRVPCVVLEAARRPGGVILSEQVDGFTIDAAADALLVQKPQALTLCEALGLGPRLVDTKPPRLAYIQRGGRLHPLPEGSVLGIPTRIGPFIGTRLFTWAGKIRMASEVFVAPRRDGRDESIAEFMTRRFGREATTYLAEPLLAGIHAGDVDRLSVRSVFPRLVDSEQQYGSVLRAFRAGLARNPRSAGPRSAFRSLPGGLSELVDALVKALPPDAIRLATRAARIVETAGGYRVEIEQGTPIEARAVILAVPAYAVAPLVRAVDTELADACATIPYSSVATVALGFARDQVRHPLNGSGFVVPRVERSGILAGSWLSSKWPDRAPEGHVLLRAFVGGARDPRALEASDAELVQRSIDALTPLVGLTGPPRLARVYRWERATPQYEVGHAERVAAIERAASRHAGLFLTGSAFRGVGIPDGIGDGRRVAAEASAGSRVEGHG